MNTQDKDVFCYLDKYQANRISVTIALQVFMYYYICIMSKRLIHFSWIVHALLMYIKYFESLNFSFRKSIALHTFDLDTIITHHRFGKVTIYLTTILLREIPTNYSFFIIIRCSKT